MLLSKSMASSITMDDVLGAVSEADLGGNTRRCVVGSFLDDLDDDVQSYITGHLEEMENAAEACRFLSKLRRKVEETGFARSTVQRHQSRECRCSDE